MTIISKKINVLLHLNWRWAFKYYPKKIKLLLSYYVSKLSGRKYWEANIDGIKIKFSFSHYYQHHLAKLLAEGKHEKQLLSIWREQSAEKNVVFDVGGYNGIFGLASGLANPESRVYIFEPDPINCQHIEENITLNHLQNTELIKAAISDKTEKARFSSHEGGSGGWLANAGFEVNCCSLDDFCEKHGIAPTLIKIDIEGAEFRALSGAKQILEKHKPRILLEIHQKFLSRYGNSLQDIDNILEQLGYKKLCLEQNERTSHFWLY